MKTRKISITMQLFVFILGTAMIAALVAGGVSYSTMEKYLRKKSMDDVVEIAVIAAENVDGETFSKAVQGEEGALTQVKEALEFFLVGDSVTYVYTLMPKDQENFQFVVDTDPEDPGEYAEDYEAQDAMFEAMEGKSSVTKDPFSDEWGTFYSGYAPILHEGKVLGIVAVDYEASSIQTSLNRLIRNMLIALAVGVLFSLLVAVLAALRMRRNFIKVNDKIQLVVSDDGDLTKALDITSGDELEVIGNSLNNLLQKTGNTVREVKNGTGNIKSKMENINTHVSGSVSRISGINDTIQSMVASSEEISATVGNVGEQVDFLYRDIQSIVDIVGQNTEHLHNINVSSEELTDTAQNAVSMIGDNMDTMSQKLQEEKKKAEAVLRIRELSDAILNISSQTNLLSLNASIEAARAGEAGKGFAVVAGEIGALAGNTNDAANEIQTMSKDVVEAIQGLSRLSEQMLELMREKIYVDYEQFEGASRRFADQSDDIWLSMEKLQKITGEYEKSLQSIRDAMNSVATATEENSNDIVEMSGMLSSVDIDMKKIETSTEETFSAISDMNRDLGHYQV